MSRAPGSALAATALLVAALSGDAGRAPRVRSDPAADALRARIAALRGSGEHAAAARAADELRARLARTPWTPAHERADAERLAATLRFVAGLEPAARARLAEADRLGAEVERLAFEGRFVPAARAAERQLEIRREILGAEHPETIECLVRLGALAERQGLHLDAIGQLEVALEMTRRALGPEHPAVVRALNHLAQAYKRRGTAPIATRCFGEALALGRKVLGRDSPEVAESLNALGNLHRSAGRLREALRLMVPALEIRRRAFGDASLEVADSRFDIGLVLVRLGRWSAAERELRRALAVRRRMLPADHPSLRETLNQLGHSLQARGRYREAEAAHRESARIGAVLHAGLLTGEAPMVLRLTDFFDLAATLLAQGREGEAWPLVERASGPMTGGLILGAEAATGFPLERVQASLGERAALIGWLDVTPGMGERHSAWGYVIRDRGPVRWVRLATTTGALGPHHYRRDALYTELVRSAAWPVRVQGTDEVTRIGRAMWRERVRPLMPHLDGIADLVVVSAGGVVGPVEAFVDSSGTFLGDHFRVAYANSASIFAGLRERAAANAAPRPRRALLIGDPPFSAAQLAAMEAEARSGADRRLESIPDRVGLPAARVLRTAAAGDRDALALLPRLVGTRWEVERLARLLPGSLVLLGPSATKAALRELARSGRLGEFDAIHIASHFLRSTDNESAIVLAQATSPSPAGTPPGRDDDGLLTGGEIASSFRLQADVVTIGGCSSAVNSPNYGEGLWGAVYPFLGSGAATGVASVVRADDRATALLMTRFYENLTGAYAGDRGRGRAAPMRKADALGEAKRWLREYRDAAGRQPYRHPAYWASFVLIGDPG